MVFACLFSYIFKLLVSQGRRKVESSVKVKIAAGAPPTVHIKKPKDGPNPVIKVFIKSSSKNSTSFRCEGVVEAGKFLLAGAGCDGMRVKV